MLKMIVCLARKANNSPDTMWSASRVFKDNTTMKRVLQPDRCVSNVSKANMVIKLDNITLLLAKVVSQEHTRMKGDVQNVKFVITVDGRRTVRQCLAHLVYQGNF